MNLQGAHLQCHVEIRTQYWRGVACEGFDCVKPDCHRCNNGRGNELLIA